MIVITNFTHAYNLFQQGQIPLRLLQEQAMLLINFDSRSNRLIDEAFDITQSDIEWLRHQDEATEDYNGMLGGELYVCQSEIDLKQVVGMDMAFAKTHGNRWPDVTDQVMSWDQCKYLKQKDGSAEWALFLLCWNDAGGNTFYVPEHLWQAANVAEHIAATEQHWGES